MKIRTYRNKLNLNLFDNAPDDMIYTQISFGLLQYGFGYHTHTPMTPSKPDIDRIFYLIIFLKHKKIKELRNYSNCVEYLCHFDCRYLKS